MGKMKKLVKKNTEKDKKIYYPLVMRKTVKVEYGNGQSTELKINGCFGYIPVYESLDEAKANCPEGMEIKELQIK